jgi:NAD-dependent DNA ligase
MDRNVSQRVADKAYEAGSPIMSDAVYDATFGDTSTHHELEIPTTAEGQTAKLPLWMGSLDKKRDEKALEAWLDKTCTDNFVISAKLDGISALYDPEDNKLYTRGNGHTGCDISKFIKHLDLERAKAGAKKVLDATPEHTWKDTPLKAYVRGELIMANEVFDLKYKKKFKNPRNLVSGQFGKKVINKGIIAGIFFVPYEVTITGMQSQCPVSEQLQGSAMLRWVEMKRPEMSVASLTQLFDDWAKDCVFAMDGLVVTEDRMYTRNVSGNPKYSVAFKKEVGGGETALTNVTDVTWVVSRWGLLKPVVNIEPVHLSGVTIHKCSGHNAKYISDNKIGPGAQIVCVRSGDVIPYIVSVVQPSDSVTLPSSTWKGVDLCVESCDADDMIEIKTLTNIFSKLEVKHVSTKTIEKMYNCGLNTFPKMMNCTKEDLHPTFKDKSADRIMAGMSDLKSRSVKVAVVVGAAGVLGFGLGAKRVENLFACLPTLMSGDWETVPAVEDVCRVDGFAEKMAERVVQCFPKMTFFLRTCVDSGLQLEDGGRVENTTVIAAADGRAGSDTAQPATAQPPASKRKICLSGFRDKELEKKYTVLSSVTKECDVLVCKSFDKETGKMTKAKKLGIRMVLLAEFEYVMST